MNKPGLSQCKFRGVFALLLLLPLGPTFASPAAQAASTPEIEQLIVTRQNQAQVLEADIKRLESLPANPMIAEQIELKKLGLAKLKAGTATLIKAADQNLSNQDEELIGTVGEALKLAALQSAAPSNGKASDSLDPRQLERTAFEIGNSGAVTAQVSNSHKASVGR